MRKFKCESCGFIHGGFHLCTFGSSVEVIPFPFPEPGKTKKKVFQGIHHNHETGLNERWENFRAANAGRDDAIVELYESGKSSLDIQKELSMSNGAVNHLINVLTEAGRLTKRDRRRPAEMVESVISRYSDTEKSYSVIAEETGVAVSTIADIVRREILEGRCEQRYTRVVSKVQAKQIKELYEDHTMSLGPIAEMFQISRQTVKKIAIKEGAIERPRGANPKQKALAIEMYKDPTKSLASIAKDTGLGINTIKRVVEKAGLPIRTTEQNTDMMKHVGTPVVSSITPEQVAIVKEYHHDSSLSLSEIGRRAGISVHAVKRVAEREGLKPRTPEENQAMIRRGN